MNQNMKRKITTEKTSFDKTGLRSYFYEEGYDLRLVNSTMIHSTKQDEVFHSTIHEQEGLFYF